MQKAAPGAWREREGEEGGTSLLFLCSRRGEEEISFHFYVSWCRSIDGIDAYQHLHVIPGTFSVIARLVIV